ncbi:hypothetical protein ACFQWB_06380 [Paenibacillus thermoaerophilus]|uniref:Bla regulator protein blaR1 n=1 Tax=Paenibacillus thermoaerophilus TaxID=1215385 RepID=A0ABW2V080_9BACL|nr:hypothetical protein [Paenibacillus thermoaerophilus]TMV18179.1 hypothetical protein FE781_04280 [Paenibacillus thermoaerophilus]
MRRNSRRIGALAMALAIMLGGCSRTVIIDWADFLKLDGRTYTGMWDIVVADPAMIGEPIGEVTFKLYGSKHQNNSRYRSKDGDAAFLPVGTRIYELKGYPDRSMVAVSYEAGMNGYKLYLAEGTAKPIELEPERVRSIQMYLNHNLAVWHGKHVKTIAAEDRGRFIEMMAQGSEEAPIPIERAENYIVLYEMEGGIGILERIAKHEGRYHSHQGKLLPEGVREFLG